MKPSIQNLIEELTAVVSEEELEFRNMSELKQLLSLLAYQEIISDVKIMFRDA